MKGSDLRVIIIGVGEMGKAGVQTIIDHNLNIVAAIDIKEDLIGKDVAEVSGYPAIGIPIEADLKAAIARTQPNVAYMASDPGWAYIKNDMITLAESKINVATTIMAPYFKMPTTAAIYEEVDEAFKKNGVSLFASGINDVWWSGIGMDAAGTCKKIESIDFTNKLPLDFMGAGVARDFRVGEDPQDYIEAMKTADLSQEEAVEGPLLALYVNAQILGLTIKSVDITTAPCICQKNREMPQWEMTIKEGQMLGQSFDIVMLTEEGITLTTSMIIKVLEDGDVPGTSWDIKGEPNLHIELGDICGEITTASTTVNRIPDVINARPGIITLADIYERPLFRNGLWKEL